MTQEEVFRVFDKFHIVYNCNIDEDGLIRLRNELNILSNDQYNNVRTLYYSTHFSPEKLSLIYNSNVENFKSYVSQSWIGKLIISDSDVNQLLVEIQDNQNYFVNRKIAKDIIEQYLKSNRFKRKILEECWEKKVHLNPKQDLVNKITSHFVNSANVLRIENIIQIYNEFEDVILIEREITDELNKFIKNHILFPENGKISLRYPKSYLIETTWKKKEVENIIVKQYDEFLSKAAQIIVNKQLGSTSLIQRKLFLGYSRSGRIMDELESLGIVGPKEGTIAHEVYTKTQDDLNVIFQQHNIPYSTFIAEKFIEEPPKLPPLYRALTTEFEKNNSEKLLQGDLIKIYAEYIKVDAQELIENITNEFINNNNLVPENEKLIGYSFREKHCSTNWMVKKIDPIVGSKPDYGKYLRYGIILVLIGVGIYYGFQLLNTGITYHTIAFDGANIRSSPDIGSDANIKEKIVYGQSFKINKETDFVTGFGGLWLKKDGWFSDRYVSNKIFVKEKDFYLLESIFGDETTKQTIKTVKCRKALIDYYKRLDPDYKFFGKIDEITYKKVFGKTKDFTDEYQVFCTDFIEHVPNSIIYPRVFYSKSKYTDFGFIVTNVSANIKRFVLYTFDGITEDPIYLGEVDATGHKLVKSVTIRSNGTLNVIFAD